MKKAVKTIILFLVIILILLLCFVGCRYMIGKTNEDTPEASQESTFKMDTGVTEQRDVNEDDSKIKESLNQKVADSMINISMNTSPTFETGSSEGYLNIVNNKVNNYPQVVEIIRDDTGEVIYKTDGIPIGGMIETDKLDVNLPKGEYKCTAFFTSVDIKTGLALGKAGAKITVTIKQ